MQTIWNNERKGVCQYQIQYQKKVISINWMEKLSPLITVQSCIVCFIDHQYSCNLKTSSSWKLIVATLRTEIHCYDKFQTIIKLSTKLGQIINTFYPNSRQSDTILIFSTSRSLFLDPGYKSSLQAKYIYVDLLSNLNMAWYLLNHVLSPFIIGYKYQP